MAHRIGGRKLSRKQGPRLALYKNLTVSILRYNRVQTTEAKAKEIRGRVERMITLAKQGDLAARRKQADKPIGQLDAMIVGIAQAHQARLATRNIRTFVDCEIQLVDPWN